MAGLLAGCCLAAGCHLSGCCLAAGWLAARLLAGCCLAAGWLLADLLAGCCLVAGSQQPASHQPSVRPFSRPAARVTERALVQTTREWEPVLETTVPFEFPFAFQGLRFVRFWGHEKGRTSHEKGRTVTKTGGRPPIPQ